MNFNEMYEQWTQNPFSQVSGTEMALAGALVMAGFLVLAFTIFKGGNRPDHWRFLGLTGAVLLTAAGAAMSLSALKSDTSSADRLRAELSQEVAAQGWTLPEYENESRLWHKLYQSGSAEVETDDGVIVLIVDESGALRVEPAPETPSDNAGER